MSVKGKVWNEDLTYIQKFLSLCLELLVDGKVVLMGTVKMDVGADVY